MAEKNKVPQVSIITPCYNAAQKIQKCLDSFVALENAGVSCEFIFVDDKSTDNTSEIISEFIAQRDNWYLYSLNMNSGSPSAPRNLGIDKAQGDFILFIDADDEVIPETVEQMLNLAVASGAELVRSSLIVDDGTRRFTTNGVRGFPASGTHTDKVKAIIKHQSTTVSTLVNRKLLQDHKIYWPTDLRVGEDTIFLVSCLLQASNVGYVDAPVQVYHKAKSAVASSTQQYGDRELSNHLEVWRRADILLKKQGLTFFELRGQVAVQNTFNTLISHGTGEISAATFTRFQKYLKQNISQLRVENFRPRIQDLVKVTLEGTFKDFQQAIKPRMVIAGMDLKFIESAIPMLSEHFTIELDRWTGHDAHDINKSQELLQWADIIWAEWMLGNAVWYSARKTNHQKMIIRLHLFELTRNFGNKVNMDAVDAVVSVSVHTLEDAIATFPIPREKAVLIPNYLDIKSYRKSTVKDADKLFSLAIVGILPARKGYLKALQLLKLLRQVDQRYELSVYGKQPKELSWVYNDKQERDYYEKCDEFVKNNGLQDFVHVPGWTDLRQDISKHGFVLSMSDFESFHVAPAEGFAAGNQAVFLNWTGVEYIYPQNYIFSSVEQIAAYILENRDPAKFENSAIEGREYVAKRYSLPKFVQNVYSLTQRI